MSDLIERLAIMAEYHQAQDRPSTSAALTDAIAAIAAAEAALAEEAKLASARYRYCTDCETETSADDYGRCASCGGGRVISAEGIARLYSALSAAEAALLAERARADRLAALLKRIADAFDRTSGSAVQFMVPVDPEGYQKALAALKASGDPQDSRLDEIGADPAALALIAEIGAVLGEQP